jgi:hypothetical protein
MHKWMGYTLAGANCNLAASRELLQDLLQGINLAELLRPEAIREVQNRLQHIAPTAQARTVEELAVLLQQLGDLSSVELAERTLIDPSGWIAQLAGSGRIVELTIPTSHGPARRWVAAEYAPEYEAAFGLSPQEQTSEVLKSSEVLSGDEARRRSDAGCPVGHRSRQSLPRLLADWLREAGRLVRSTPGGGRYPPASRPGRG